jgi:hypothetical protein
MLMTNVRPTGNEWDLFARDRVRDRAQVDLLLWCSLPAMVISPSWSIIWPIPCMLIQPVAQFSRNRWEPQVLYLRCHCLPAMQNLCQENTALPVHH